MNKRLKERKNMKQASKLDTVGVVGSIPIAPTINANGPEQQVIEIPQGFEVVPALSFSRGRFRLYRVLTNSSSKKCGKSVSSSRVRRSA